MPKLNQDYDATLETTAVLSILKEQPYGSARGEHLGYTILVWLTGKILTVPYRMAERVHAGSRTELLKRLASLASQCERFYTDHELSDHERRSFMERVTIVGEDIARYLRPLDRCLSSLATSDMSIKNLIIHTDERAIPWHLALSEYSLEFDFLCNRYACGTILVDDAEVLESLERRGELEAGLPRFIRQSKLSRQPDISELSAKQFCLIAGEVGQTTSEGKDLGLVYMEKLRDRLQAAGHCQMAIQCVSAAEWAKNERDPIEEIRRIFRSAQIVHFTAHFVDGKMRLGQNFRPIGPEDLVDHLPQLSSKPLVVLQGCVAAGFAGNSSGEGSELCKALLNRGVGGCLATVFPVDNLTGDAKMLMEIFYDNIFKYPWKSYGETLRAARREFNRLRPNHPEALFYQLFGDPRETLVSTRVKTVTELLAQAEISRNFPQKTAATLRVSGERLDEQGLLQTLREVEGVLDVNRQPALRSLGDAELITEIGSTLLTVVMFSPSVLERIVTRLEKRFGRAIRVQITDQSTFRS